MLIDLNVKVSKTEFTEMTERLSNWDKLHRDVVENPPSLEELVKLIHVEVHTRKRMLIAKRLLGMYQRQARTENERRLVKALGAK